MLIVDHAGKVGFVLAAMSPLKDGTGAEWIARGYTFFCSRFYSPDFYPVLLVKEELPGNFQILHEDTFSHFFTL